MRGAEVKEVKKEETPNGKAQSEAGIQSFIHDTCEGQDPDIMEPESQ